MGVHPQPRLVEVDHARCGQLVADGIGEQAEPGGGAFVPGHHRPVRDGGAEQVGQRFRGPGDRQVLGAAQVGRDPADPGPYWVGALTPSGAAAIVVCPQRHRRTE